MRRAAHTAWRTLGEETIVVDLVGRRIRGLGGVGGWVWSQLDGRPLEQLHRAVIALPDAPHDASDQLQGFLDELAAAGLVDEGPPLAAIPATAVPGCWISPTIAWDEALQQAAASCGFIPGQTPLCSQVPSV